MKARIHIVGALFGCVCALAFALAPFVASADAGPGKLVAPARAPIASGPTAHGLKHMNRGNVGRQDDGCGS